MLFPQVNKPVHPNPAQLLATYILTRGIEIVKEAILDLPAKPHDFAELFGNQQETGKQPDRIHAQLNAISIGEHHGDYPGDHIQNSQDDNRAPAYFGVLGFHH